MSLDQYHTEEEIYQMSLQREPRKPAVSTSLSHYALDKTVMQCGIFDCFDMMDGVVVWET